MQLFLLKLYQYHVLPPARLIITGGATSGDPLHLYAKENITIVIGRSCGHPSKLEDPA